MMYASPREQVRNESGRRVCMQLMRFTAHVDKV
jgi:hypothetical protein